MKKHLEAYLMKECQLTFSDGKEMLHLLVKMTEKLFLRQERGVITHPLPFDSGQFIEMLYWG